MGFAHPSSESVPVSVPGAILNAAPAGIPRSVAASSENRDDDGDDAEIGPTLYPVWVPLEPTSNVIVGGDVADSPPSPTSCVSQTILRPSEMPDVVVWLFTPPSRPTTTEMATGAGPTAETADIAI